LGVFDQRGFATRFEWGEDGVEALAPISDVVVIVDVLSFSTSVELATSQGAWVYPCNWRDESLHAFAARMGAEVAGVENPHGRSLSPSTLEDLPPELRMVLPSLNGSQLTMAAKSRSIVIAGCLRNARAVAARARALGETVAVIACGERWRDSTRLRPALEDLIGAGAILRHLGATHSPEAQAAIAAFNAAEGELLATLTACASGREKGVDGKQRDVELAAQLDVSTNAPMLIEGSYRAEEGRAASRSAALA
jgi:2-phosphosulfolactate phosphatase